MDDNIQPGALEGGDVGAQPATNGDGAEAGAKPKTNGDGAVERAGAVEKDGKKTAVEKLKRQMLEWLDETAAKVIKVVGEDAALRFHDADLDDEEQHGALDLKGRFDPVVDETTGALLSEMLAEKAREFRDVFPPGQAEKVLPRLYRSKLKEKWAKQKLTSELPGKKIGKRYLANRSGVWVKADVSVGLDELYVWRRFVRTQIEPFALSRDTSLQRNWRHRYLVTDETGQFEVEVDKAALGKHANERFMAKRMGAKTIEVNASHLSLISHPEEIMRLILEAAGQQA